MKKIIAYGDTETTGTTYSVDQILDYATVFTEKNKVVESVNREIVVKKNNIPEPGALLVNNINPFNEEWSKKAVSEYDAVLGFIDEINKYKKEGSLLYMAYNAPFDVQMFEQTFLRCGKNFHSLVPVVFDLYILAKMLIDKGVLKTRETDFGPSGKLGDVYAALGFSKSEMNAHNALGDSIILPDLANKLYLLYCGKEISDITIDPSEFKPKDIHSVLFINPLSYKKNRSLQFEEKTILILKNDVENRKLHILDNNTISSSANKTPTAGIQIVDYAQIFDEILMNVEQTKMIQKYILVYKDHFSLNEDKIKPFSPPSIDLPHFDKVISLSKKMRTSGEYSETLKTLTDEELDLLSQAEEYSYSKYNEGWSFDIYGKTYRDEYKELFKIENNTISIGIDPILGNFMLKQNGETIVQGTKTAVLNSLIASKVFENTKNEMYKKISLKLGSFDNLENKKNLKNIKDQFNKEKNHVFNGANKLHKEILTSLLKFYKDQYGYAVQELKIPDFKLNLGGFKRKD